MKTKPIGQTLFIILFFMVLILGIHPFLCAAQDTTNVLDVIVKVARIEEKLNLIDDLIKSGPKQPMKSPTAMLRGMLQGTDWIDADRLIVFGLVMNQESQPEMAVLIPFRTPNPNFQAGFNALAGPDFYIISLPPGAKPEGVSEAIQNALVEASASKSRDFLTVEVAVNRLLKNNDQKIRELIQKLEKLPIDSKRQNIELSPQDLQDVLLKMIDTIAQVEVLSESIDIDADEISFSLKAAAVEESDLSRLFVRGEMMTFLDNYRPSRQITFRSHRYEFKGFIELIDAVFGKFYEKIGIDFSQLSTIMNHFTGEMAGGMTFSNGDIQFEMISVLRDGAQTPDFLESEYLPWLEKYIQNMTELTENQLGRKIDDAFVRTADSIVEGHKVVGVNIQLPFMPRDQNRPVGRDMPASIKYEWRIATVGNYFLVAPNDDEMAELVKITRKLKEDVSIGPLVSMDINLGDYLSAIAKFAGLPEGSEELPRTGNMSFIGDVEGGQVYTTSKIRLSDIRTVMAYYSKLGSLGTTVGMPSTIVGKKPELSVIIKDADYWADRGALCATYGNNERAITYYHKAITMEPQKSDVYFYLGISHGELGNFEKAIDAFNKAISIDSGKAPFYYGRGRVYLMSGKKDLALKDFRFAADAGDIDAQRYLKITVPEAASNF